jgi:hypothetical protein
VQAGQDVLLPVLKGLWYHHYSVSFGRVGGGGAFWPSNCWKLSRTGFFVIPFRGRSCVSRTDNSPLLIDVSPCITHGSFHVRCRRQRY